MARPITWQDVAAPRGNALAIEAMLRSGRQAGEGFEQIGQTFMDANKAQKEAATGAAVAAIANSNDPLAQAAATPQGWQFDPLAVASAANSRGEQLEAAETRELAQESSSLQIKESQARLDDALAKREAEDLALPYRTDIFSGKKVEIDRTDPRWQTAAGKYALDRIDNWQKEYQDNWFQGEELKLRRAAEARGARSEAQQLKTQDLFNQITAKYSTAAGAAEEEGTRDKWIADLLTQNKMGHVIGDARKMALLTLEGNKPTEAELNQEVGNTGLTGNQIREIQAARVAANEQTVNQRAALLQDAVATGDLVANNPYQTDDLQTAYNQFKTRTEAGKGIAKDWGSDDFRDRAQGVIDYAKNEYNIDLPSRYAYLMVERTVGGLNPLDKYRGMNDAVKQGVAQYAALQKRGGYEQVKADLAADRAAADRVNATIQRDLRISDAAVRDPNAQLPDTLTEALGTDPGFRRARLENEVAKLKAKLEAADTGGYRKSREYSRIASQLDAKIAELRGVK